MIRRPPPFGNSAHEWVRQVSTSIGGMTAEDLERPLLYDESRDVGEGGGRGVVSPPALAKGVSYIRARFEGLSRSVSNVRKGRAAIKVSMLISVVALVVVLSNYNIITDRLLPHSISRPGITKLEMTGPF